MKCSICVLFCLSFLFSFVEWPSLCCFGLWVGLRQSCPPHSLWFHRKNALYWHFKAQSMASPCRDKGSPVPLVSTFIHSVIGFGHVSASCCVIIRRVLLHHLGTRLLTLLVISWVSGFVLAFSSTKCINSMCKETVCESAAQHWQLSCYCLFMSKPCMLCALKSGNLRHMDLMHFASW